MNKYFLFLLILFILNQMEARKTKNIFSLRDISSKSKCIKITKITQTKIE